MTYSDFRNSERAGWNTRAGRYADATARATLQSIPALLSHAQLFPKARVLDAGCGPGYVAAMAALLGAQARGVDFADEMVALARKNFANIPFETADVEALPMQDNRFDAVIGNMVLFHVTDPARAMAETHRVLVPNGVFAFSQWLGPDRSECYRLLFDVIGDHADMTLADPAPDAYALSDKDHVTSMMQGAGFESIRFELVENVLHAPGPSFYDFFMTFGVRVPLILDRQDAATRDKIRTEIDRRAAAYLSDGIYKIPMPSLVISGRASKA